MWKLSQPHLRIQDTMEDRLLQPDATGQNQIIQGRDSGDEEVSARLHFERENKRLQGYKFPSWCA